MVGRHRRAADALVGQIQILPKKGMVENRATDRLQTKVSCQTVFRIFPNNSNRVIFIVATAV